MNECPKKEDDEDYVKIVVVSNEDSYDNRCTNGV